MVKPTKVKDKLAALCRFFQHCRSLHSEAFGLSTPVVFAAFLYRLGLGEEVDFQATWIVVLLDRQSFDGWGGSERPYLS